jgi:xanthine dehydrogenase YagR molybdenum-binding subunit
VKKAAQEALKKLIQTAISDETSLLHSRKEDEVTAANGRKFAKGSAPESGIPYGSVLACKKLAAVDGESTLNPGEERSKYAFQSFGAQFVEVRIDPEIAKITVSRVCSAFDAGRIINLKTARSQAYSGIIMGLGMALMEHTVYDERNGSIVIRISTIWASEPAGSARLR